MIFLHQEQVTPHLNLMHLFFLIRVLGTVVVGSFLANPSQISSPTTSLEAFHNMIRATSDGDAQVLMIRSALDSGRADFINECCDFSGTSEYFWIELLNYPDGIHKDKILLMLLRTKHNRWPDPTILRQGSSGLVEYMKEPFSSFILKYLPTLRISQELVATPTLRLKLADRIEAAMTGKPLAEVQRNQKAEAQLTAESKPDEGSIPKASEKKVTPAFIFKADTKIVWWAAGFAVLCAIIVVVFKRKK